MIKLTLVCKNFNQTIGSSKELMKKIRLKISPSKDSQSFQELNNLLQCSDRRYENLSVNNAQCDSERCLEFIRNNSRWKSLKLSTCHFTSAASKVAFLSIISEDLEEAEFENVIIDQLCLFNYQSSQPDLFVSFPKLTKLRCGILPAELRCTDLKVLDLTLANQHRILQLLKANRKIEDLTMTYEVLDAVFKRPDIFEMEINLRLKKLQLHRHHGTDPMDTTSNRNFQMFLKSQADCLEEVVIDWFSGKPPMRRSTSNEWFPSCRRLRGDAFERGIDERRVRFQRRRLVDDDFNPNDDICVKAVTTIFQEFTAIKKLIVSDKQGFLQDTSCPSVTVLNLIPNPSISELRLRFEKAPLSDVLFEKLVAASPNVKSLYVHEMDQPLLETCARKMKHLESIFALSLRVDNLPNEKVKFNKLKRFNFCECIVNNHPELQDKKLFEQKLNVMKMIT